LINCCKSSVLIYLYPILGRYSLKYKHISDIAINISSALRLYSNNTDSPLITEMAFDNCSFAYNSKGMPYSFNI